MLLGEVSSQACCPEFRSKHARNIHGAVRIMLGSQEMFDPARLGVLNLLVAHTHACSRM